jgi:hypothetical protein
MDTILRNHLSTPFLHLSCNFWCWLYLISWDIDELFCRVTSLECNLRSYACLQPAFAPGLSRWPRNHFGARSAIQRSCWAPGYLDSVRVLAILNVNGVTMTLFGQTEPLLVNDMCWPLRIMDAFATFLSDQVSW